MLKRALKTVAALMAFLPMIALAAQSRQPATPSPSNSIPLVRAISVHNSPQGAVIIDVRVTRPVGYRTFELSSPERLVVDLQGARKAILKRVYPVQSQLIERVRIGQWRSDPPIVRVVADLKGTPAFSVKHLGSGVQIRLEPGSSVERTVYGFAMSRTRSARNNGVDHAKRFPRRLAQSSPFAVHRFKDLSASLTAPELPAQDKLVPVTEPDLPNHGRGTMSTPALVSGISIRPDSMGETLVDIASSRSVPYRVFQLTDPYRLVVDLKDAHNASRRAVYPVDSSVLKRIRVAQWRPGDPPVVRVVADLQGYPIFDVHAEKPGIHIELWPRRRLGPLIRNPFKFAIPQRSTRLENAQTQANEAMTSAVSSPAVLPNVAFGLKVIGFVEHKDSAIQAVISDRSGIYFVPNGGTFENTFRVIAIAPDAVEIQNIETLDSSWLAYTP